MHVDNVAFAPLPALLGGVLIGLSASWLLYFHGRIAGISGLLAGLVAPGTTDRGLRAWFVTGLVVAGIVLFRFSPAAFAMTPDRSLGALAVAGLLVGYGTRVGNGCTSGHGVCGLSRGSVRSLVAVVTFMSTAGLTVAIIRQFFGGRL